MVNDQLHICINVVDITDVYYRRCVDSDRDVKSKPKAIKSKSLIGCNDDITRPVSEYIKIEVQCDQYINTTDAVSAQFNFMQLNLPLHMHVSSTSEMIQFLIDNPIQLSILEYDSITNTCSRIGISCIDALEVILRGQDSDQISRYPITYVFGISPLTEIFIDDGQGHIVKKTDIPSAQCRIRLNHNLINVVQDLNIYILHLQVSNIKINDPHWRRTDPLAQYVQDQVQVQVQLGPVFPVSIPLTSSASDAYSVGNGSSDIRTGPFYLYHVLNSEEYGALSRYIESEEKALIHFFLSLHCSRYLIDDQIDIQDKQVQVEIDMKPLMHPIEDVRTTHIEEIVDIGNMICSIDICVYGGLYTQSIPSPLQLIRNDYYHITLSSHIQDRAVHHITSHIHLALHLLKSGYNPSMVLHSNLSHRFSADIQHLYHAHRSCSKSDSDPDYIQSVLHDRIVKLLYGDDNDLQYTNDIDELRIMSQLYMKAGLYAQSLQIQYYIHVQSDSGYNNLYVDMGTCHLHLGQYDHLLALLNQHVDSDVNIWLILTCAAIEYEQYGRARKLILSVAPGTVSISVLQKILQLVYRLCVEDVILEHVQDELREIVQFESDIIELVTHLLDWNLIRISDIIFSKVLSRDINLYQCQDVVIQRIRSLIAMKQFKKARDLLPMLSDVMIRSELSGDIEFEAGDFDSACILYRQCYEMNTEHLRTLYRYAMISANRCNIQTSIEVYLHITKLYPLLGEAWYQQAIQYNTLGQSYQLHSQHCLSESIRYNPYCNDSWQYLHLDQ